MVFVNDLQVEGVTTEVEHAVEDAKAVAVAEFVNRLHVLVQMTEAGECVAWREVLSASLRA